MGAARAPRKGQRVIVHGVRITGGTPAAGGGTFATYRGRRGGLAVFEGNTADPTFVDLDRPGVTWEPRHPLIGSRR